MPVHIKAERIHVEDIQIFPGKNRGEGLQSVIVERVILLIPNDRGRWFIIVEPLGKIRSFDELALRQILRHGKPKRRVQSRDEQLQKPL